MEIRNTKTEFKRDLIQFCSNNDKAKLINIFLEKYNAVPEFALMVAEIALECHLCPETSEQIICQTVEKGYTDIVKILIEHSFNFIARTHKGYPVQIACRKGHLALVKDLIYHIELHKESWLKYEGLESLVAISCQNGHLDILEFLVNRGASLDIPEIMPLPFYATINGHQDVLKYLLQQMNSSFEINSSTKPPGNIQQEFNLLHMACITKQLHIIKFLIEKHTSVSRSLVERYPDCIADVLQQKICVYNVGEQGEDEQYSAVWNGICMDCIPDKVLLDNFNAIVHIDLSSCNLKEVTHEIYRLPNITLIDLSLNEITQLDTSPTVEWECYKLEKLNACKNKLKFIPNAVFTSLPNLRHLDLSYNRIENFNCELETCENPPETKWNLPQLEVIDLNHNSIQFLPDNLGCLHNLRSLNVSSNKLEKLSNTMTKGTHKLEILNLSDNRLQYLPQDISKAWGTSLQVLNLKGNFLVEISGEICQLIRLNSLTVSHNSIRSFPHVRQWETQGLQKLDFSHNKLSFNLINLSSTPDERKFPIGMNMFTQQKVKTNTLKQQSSQIDYSTSISSEETQEVPVDLWANTLMYMDLSDNKITVLPDYIGNLTSLVNLNLSNNKDLTTLPPTLGRLKHCYQLGVENLRLNISQSSAIEGMSKTKSILSYLRTELRNSVPSRHMKLMVVGLAGQGKTTLLQVLKSGQQKNELAKNEIHRSTATNGIEINKWNLAGKEAKNKSGAPVEFSTWDLGGQEVYYATHQCFLTKNTLYLLVFNLKLGEEAILQLQPWLLNIQARAPNSPVIIVGTHLDEFKDEASKATVDEIREKVNKLYLVDRQNKYPDIVSVQFVSCTKIVNHNIDILVKAIYETASNLKIAETHEKVIGQMVPKSYIDLQKCIEKERDTRKNEGNTSILKYIEMERIAATVQDEELQDKAELDQAASYLHNNGYILHYEELIGQLSDIYFIDPTWICDLFAQIVTVKETNNWVKNGIIKELELQFIFQNQGKFFFLDYKTEYLYIMEKFEILINLGEGRLLIPSMLPLDRPNMVDQVIPTEYKLNPQSPLDSNNPLQDPLIVTEQSTILRRLIYFSFIPSGFWNRLISRILVKIRRKEYGEAVDFSLNINSQQIIYWRRGIAMQLGDSRFVIESISRSAKEIGGMQPGQGFHRNTRLLRGIRHEDKDQDENEGVDITVYSSTYDFTWMGCLVDQVDNLLKEWFPGLDDQDVFGEQQVRRYCPWKVPKSLLTELSEERKEIFKVIANDYYYMFKYEDCVLLSIKDSHIYCEELNVKIPLEYLIPETCLADLHDDFKLNVSQLKYEKNKSVIGEGATSNVFKGTYKQKSVAVKEFSYRNPNKRGAIRTSDINIDTILDLIRMIRAEVSLQCRFQHPFILQLLGASIRPLVIVLELAPLGDLANVLSERANKLNEEWIEKNNATAPPPMPGGVLGYRLTFKIALQIILAIEYLHNNKVIYRDLKAQNILVFSLDENEILNVKLSDYGIAVVAQPSFNKGQEGTPGFIPPEAIPQRNIENVITTKVDIFAYGMVLYELITGRYPFYPRIAHQEIIKAVLLNIHPDVYGQNRTPCCPNIISLMEECWKKSPSERPSAQDIIRKLIDPAFFLLRNHITEVDKEGMHKVNYMMDIPYSKSHDLSILDRALCLWGVEQVKKRCSLINVKNKKKIESRLPTEQPVESACVVEEKDRLPRIWISTSKQRPTSESGYREIEIYGQISRSGSYCCLWRYITKDTVLCLVSDNINGKPLVYASLLSGHFHAYAKKADFLQERGFTSMKHDEYAVTSERNSEECAQWNTVLKLQIGTLPVNSILVVNDEIWCACGGDIHILDRQTRNSFHKITVFLKDTSLKQMVFHDGMVYVTTFKGDESSITVVSVQERNVIGILSCMELNPNKKMVFIKNNEAQAVGMNLYKQLSVADEDEAKPTNPCSLHAKQLYPQSNDSSTVKFVVPTELISLRNFPKQSIHDCKGQYAPSRIEKIMEGDETEGKKASTSPNNLEIDRKEVKVRSIMARNGLLWVGRAMGDILLINIDTKREWYGEVISILRVPHDDKTLYGVKSLSLLCPTQEEYVANYQQLVIGNTGQKEHIVVWEAVSLDRLEELIAQNKKLLTCTYKPHIC